MNRSFKERETILIVDDMPANIRILGQLLRDRYHVLAATRGEKALAIAASENPPDLILLDIVMPDMDGYEVCRRLKEKSRGNDIPVIFITAKGEVEDETKGLETGAVDYIVKPFSPPIIMARVRTHLALKRQRDELAQMTMDLRELNRMKDDLLAVTSHDLRSPLNGILGFADLLLEKDYLDDEDQEALAHIKTSGNVLLSLVNDILDLSKVRSEQVELKLEPLVLADVIKTSISSLKHLAMGKRQSLHFKDQSDHRVIMGNASALGRVFNNLLSNAIKFTPEQGSIHLMIEPVHEGTVGVSVKDTGIGISEEKVPYLFDQYTRTSQSGTSGEKGTGLGMSIVKELLEKQTIPITVKSEVGKGTVFRMVFSLAQEESPSALKASSPVILETPLNILLADDNPVNGKLGQKILGKQGHHVQTVINGKEALDAYRQRPESIDMIFMDIQMPEMDGLEGTRAIREFEAKGLKTGGVKRRVPIVAMTGSARKEDREKCMAAGMDDYVIKPVKKEIVQEMVQKWGP